MPELLTTGVTRGADKAFTITELRRVGSGAGTSGLVPTGVKFVWTASTHSIPTPAWSFGVEQRTARDDYPGAEEPVEQVLGWNYAPFTLSGVWDDRYGGEDFALSTWQEFELLIKRGNPVRLDFEQVSITGLIKGCEFTYKRRDLIGYKFTFSPHQRIEKETVLAEPAGGFRATMDPRTVAKLARAKLEALQAAQALATAANLSVVQGALADADMFRDLTADLDSISAAIGSVENIVNEQIFKFESAANAFLRATQILASVKTTCATALTRIRAVGATTALGVQTATALLDFDTWNRGLGAQLREMIVTADDSQKQLNARSQPAVRNLHRARANESLYTISNHYYGTPHRWREISERNGLTALVLDGGELLVIPD